MVNDVNIKTGTESTTTEMQQTPPIYVDERQNVSYFLCIMDIYVQLASSAWGYFNELFCEFIRLNFMNSCVLDGVMEICNFVGFSGSSFRICFQFCCKKIQFFWKYEIKYSYTKLSNILRWIIHIIRSWNLCILILIK